MACCKTQFIIRSLLFSDSAIRLADRRKLLDELREMQPEVITDHDDRDASLNSKLMTRETIDKMYVLCILDTPLPCAYLSIVGYGAID